MAEEEIQGGGEGAVERYDSAASEIARMYRDAEQVINEWLDEADLEGAAIIERARAEASRQTSEMKVSASEAIAAALREADEAATARRRAADDEAEHRLKQAEEEAEWRRRQAEADAAALEARATASASTVVSEVGRLHDQLTELIQQASALLPTLEAARQLALAPGAEVEVEVADVEVAAVEVVEDDEVVDAEIVPEPEVEFEPEPVPEPVEPPRQRGLGQLVRDGTPPPDDLPVHAPAAPTGSERRRGLGRLLGRR